MEAGQAVTATIPDYAHTQGAEQNRILKARKIARWLWERDLGYSNVLAADEKRRREWARQALVTPPSTMETWQAVNDALVAMERFAEDHPDHPQVARTHAEEREKWLGELAEHEPLPGAAPEPVAEAVEEPLATVHQLPRREDHAEQPVDPLIAETAPAADLVKPRGWDELVELGPIRRSDARCRCGGQAVTFTRSSEGREEWRCAAHPPQPGEWGATLNWTPRGPECLCARGRCYCGRGAEFTLGGQGFRVTG